MSDNKIESLSSPDDWKPISTFIIEYQANLSSKNEEGKKLALRTYCHSIDKDKSSCWESIDVFSAIKWQLDLLVALIKKEYRRGVAGSSEISVNKLSDIAEKRITIADCVGNQALLYKQKEFRGFVIGGSVLKIVIDVRFKEKVSFNIYMDSTFNVFLKHTISNKEIFVGACGLQESSQERFKVRGVMDGLNIKSGVYVFKVLLIMNNGCRKYDFFEADSFVVI